MLWECCWGGIDGRGLWACSLGCGCGCFGGLGSRARLCEIDGLGRWCRCCFEGLGENQVWFCEIDGKMLGGMQFGDSCSGSVLGCCYAPPSQTADGDRGSIWCRRAHEQDLRVHLRGGVVLLGSANSAKSFTTSAAEKGVWSTRAFGAKSLFALRRFLSFFFLRQLGSKHQASARSLSACLGFVKVQGFWYRGGGLLRGPLHLHGEAEARPDRLSLLLSGGGGRSGWALGRSAPARQRQGRGPAAKPLQSGHSLDS